MEFRKYQRKPFDEKACTRCGICLEQCPVMQLPPDKAQEAISKLASGGSVPEVERRCTSCFACNVLCPEDCRPANLFLDRWWAAYQKEGLPARAEYFLPHSDPNFRSFLLRFLPKDQRALVESWKRMDPAGEIIFSGCNLAMTPYMTQSKIFAGFDIRGGFEYCCGEMYFRMGLYDRVEEIAARLTEYFRALGARKVWSVCTACLNILENVLPQFGADFGGIEFEHFQSSILARLESGELKIKKPLDMTVTVQESCHAKLLAPDFFELPRAILEKIGVTIEESEYSREKMLCCGIGGGFSHASAYSPFEILFSGGRTLRELSKTRADSICVYCPGCLESLSMARTVQPTVKPVYHLLELVQKAMGEKLVRRQNTLALQLLLGTVANQFPRLLSSGRFKLDPLPLKP